MVPKGWSAPKLGDFMDFKNGLNTDKSQYGSGVKFVNVMDVFGNDILKQSVIKGRVQIPESRLRENLLQYGDVLFNRTSETFEEIAMSAVYLDDAPATFGGFVIRGRDKNQVLDPNFSVYVFQSNRFRQEVVRLGQGAVRANIGQKDLSKVELPVPPRSEQKKIAQILSTWDKAITTTEQLLANSQQQKKALMQQLLTGKKRLLDENGVRFSGEWEVITLDEIFTFKKGKGLSKSELSDTGKWKCLLYGELYTKYPEVIDEVLSRTNKNDGVPSCSGDILIPSSTTTSGIDLANATAILEDGVRLGGDINILRAKGDLSPSFFAHLLTHAKKYEIASRAQGITIIHLYGSDLKNMTVKIPTNVVEQAKIGRVLEFTNQELATLEIKLDRLKQEKKALMQQLLTGKRRVKVDEEAA